MQRFLMVGLLTGLVLTSAPAALDINQTMAFADTTNPRYDLYLAPQFGLRFVYPDGYRVSIPLAYPQPGSGDPRQMAIALWKTPDYYPWGVTYEPRPEGTEPPPHISLEVFPNPTERPLQDWMELATSAPTVITVAAQGAIAYSATGLYESDVVLFPTPDGAYVVKLQVGYLDAEDPIRQSFQSVVASVAFDGRAAIGKFDHINYTRLQTLLANGDWQGADLETRAILMQLLGTDYFYPHLEKAQIEALPCEELRIIDALWSRYSNGRYGFQAQQQIWAGLAATDRQAQAAEFGQQVGWRRAEPLVDTWLDALWKADTEVTYTAAAPAGHLPWPGVASMTFERMVMESGAACGTCTVDAIYISGDRFADYLDAFMARAEACFCDAQ